MRERQFTRSENFKERETKTRVATIIIAGGEGRRLRPLTFLIPKPMLPYAGKLLIDHAIDSCREWSGTVIVSANEAVSGRIHGYVSKRSKDIVCLKEEKLLKVGGVLKRHLYEIEQLGIDNLVILMADHVRSGSIQNAVVKHEESSNDLTLFVSKASSENNQVVVQNEIVVDYLPAGCKPNLNSYSFCGECVFRWSALRDFLLMEEKEIFDLGWSIVFAIIKQGSYKIGVYDIGQWRDIGTWRRYLSI